MSIEISIFEPVTGSQPAFGRIGLTHGAVDISLLEKLAIPGEFRFTLPLGARYADKLAKNQLVRIDGRFWGIIDALAYRWDEGGAVIEVSGRDLKGLVADRITLPPLSGGDAGTQGYDAVNGSTESCMKHYVDVNMVRSVDPLRNVPRLAVGLDLGRGVPDDKYLSRHDKLDEVLQALGEAAGLGYDIVPDLTTGAYIFDVIQGVDRSGIQSDRPRVVFDIARKTAQSQIYTSSQRDERNAFYTTRSGAEFEDEALTILYIRANEEARGGIFRREQHLSISADTPMAGEEYMELQRMALIDAENYRPVESFECTIMPGRLEYGSDYFLGDTITVQNREWGVTAHPMLMAMSTEYGEGGVIRTATFGKAPLTVFGRLKRQVKGG